MPLQLYETPRRNYYWNVRNGIVLAKLDPSEATERSYHLILTTDGLADALLFDYHRFTGQTLSGWHDTFERI